MNQDPKIGIFICECSGELEAKIHCADLAGFAARLEGVKEVQVHPSYCMQLGLEEIKKAVAERGVDRVVIAGCSPRTHSPLFMKAVSEAKLNPYLLEVVNIRDHAAAVAPDRESAWNKACNMLKIAVARAARLAPLENAALKPEKRVVVIGTGIAGLTAARELASRGLDVLAVEKAEAAGGMLRRHFLMLPGPHKTDTFLGKLLQDLGKRPKVKFMFGAEVTGLTGETGAYEVLIKDQSGERKVPAGAVVVASGAEEFLPEGLFGFDGRSVLTQSAFESKLREGLDPLVKSLAMIQCAGGRSERIPYCSRICCMTAMKNALWIKEQKPLLEISILFRDIYTGGPIQEADIATAAAKGIKFIRYGQDDPPVVQKGDGDNLAPALKIAVRDILTNTMKEIACDLVVLSNPVVPGKDSSRLSHILGLPLDPCGFLIDHCVRVKPSHFVEKGIFVCGNAHFPLSPYECRTHAYGTASRIANLLLQDELTGNAFYSEPDPAKCIACGQCEIVCPYNAIKVVADEKGKKARTSAVNCLGCGTCAAGCPTKAISMRHFTDDQISSQIAVAAS